MTLRRKISFRANPYEYPISLYSSHMAKTEEGKKHIKEKKETADSRKQGQE
jgi:hypothetical protein